MKISDIKAGGWVRVKRYDDTEKIYHVIKFEYDKEYKNGYCFYFNGEEFGLCLEREQFKYSENAADLMKDDEMVVATECGYEIVHPMTKREFVELQSKGGK